MQWRKVHGFERYEVSDAGLVRNSKSGRILRAKINNGYRVVDLSVGGVITRKRVGRLVALAFIPNMDSRPEVNHKNGVRNDDRVENLEWATRSENTLHAYRVLNAPAVPNVSPMYGESNPTSKLSSADVDRVHDLLEDGVTQTEIARLMGITQPAVSHIKTGRRRRHG